MRMRGYYDDRTIDASILKGGKAVRTWIKELGILWIDAAGVKHSFRMAARDGKEMARGAGYVGGMEYNGKALPLLSVGSKYTLPGGLTLAFTGYEKQGGGFFDVDAYSLEVDGLIKLDVKLRPAHPLLQTDADAQTHINLHFANVERTPAMHGIMGQTYREDRRKRALEYTSLLVLLRRSFTADGVEGRGYLDGEVKDYRMLEGNGGGAVKRPSDWTQSKARNQEGNAYTASGEADDSTESLVLLAGDGINSSNDAWFLDTGATQHMTHSASLLNNIGAPGDVKRVVFGNDKLLPVVGVGSTRLIVDSGPVDITNVLHVPGLKVNLLSVTQLVKKDVKVTIDGAKMNLFWKGKQFAQSVLNGQLYQLKTHLNTASSNVAHGSKATLKMWHNRLAHANYDSVKELANKGLAKGFDVIAGNDEKGVCAACVEEKMARKPFGSRTSPLAKDPLALVHMDVCGPMRHASKGGARFLLVMLDDLQPKARAAIYSGIAANERAWRVWDLDEKRVVTSRDVIFDEAKFPTTEKQTPQLTVVLPAREEDEVVEVPPHVQKGRGPYHWR
ncbi:unnamed protein product [Closterium sp. NIES-64]|nr:unnamed protein product [Closterium sp. NIES-64]